MSGRTSAVVAGVCGVSLFIAYCIYFDRKRRSDPHFKEKLRERKCFKLLAQQSTYNITPGACHLADRQKGHSMESSALLVFLFIIHYSAYIIFTST